MSLETYPWDDYTAPLPALDRPLPVTFFAGFAARSKHATQISMRALCERLATTRAPSKAALPWLKLATFGDARTEQGSLRHDANVTSIDGIEADYDGEAITIARARQVIGGANLAAIIYTSPSHAPDKPRWRILCPTSHAMAPSRRESLVARLNGLFVGALARESYTLSQAYYFGAITGADHHEVVALDGRYIDEATDLDASAIHKPAKPAHAASPPRAPAPYRAPSDATPYGRKSIDQACADIAHAGHGNKHHTLNREAFGVGQLVAGGEVADGEAFARLQDALEAMHARQPCDDYRAAVRTLHTAYSQGKANPRSAPPRSITVHVHMPPEPPPLPDPPEWWNSEPVPDLGQFDDNPTGLKDAPATPGMPLIYLPDIQPNLDTADFVEGVLVDGSSCIVYGESNAGKTFFFTDLALSVAAGQSWFGREVEQGGVVYCVLEGGFGFRNRVRAWLDFNGHGDDLPFAAITSSINLLDPEADLQRLIDAVQEAARTFTIPVKLIVIDTLARAFAGGNENSSEDMGRFVLNIDALRRATGACVAGIHHSGKDQAKGARGHSSLRAAIDTEIEVIATEAENGEVTRKAKCQKQRDMPKFDDFGFGMQIVEMGKNRRNKPVTTCVIVPAETTKAEPKAKSMSSDQRQAFEILCDAIATDGATGYAGIPKGASSIPEDWWKDRFHARAKPGASPDTKQKAFRRASDALIRQRMVAMNNGRVWLTDTQKDA